VTLDQFVAWAIASRASFQDLARLVRDAEDVLDDQDQSSDWIAAISYRITRHLPEIRQQEPEMSSNDRARALVDILADHRLAAPQVKQLHRLAVAIHCYLEAHK